MARTGLPLRGAQAGEISIRVFYYLLSPQCAKKLCFLQKPLNKCVLNELVMETCVLSFFILVSWWYSSYFLNITEVKGPDSNR